MKKINEARLPQNLDKIGTYDNYDGEVHPVYVSLRISHLPNRRLYVKIDDEWYFVEKHEMHRVKY